MEDVLEVYTRAYDPRRPQVCLGEVVVADQRTAIDFAQVIQHLVDVHYPHADKIVLLMDNLNAHKPGSLYEAFEPAEARRLADKLEIHFTPKHASWLDMAELRRTQSSSFARS
jgi:hypothetical protein